MPASLVPWCTADPRLAWAPAVRGDATAAAALKRDEVPVQAAVGTEVEDVLQPGSGTELLAFVELPVPGPEPAEVVEQSTRHAFSIHGRSFWGDFDVGARPRVRTGTRKAAQRGPSSSVLIGVQPPR